MKPRTFAIPIARSCPAVAPLAPSRRRRPPGRRSHSAAGKGGPQEMASARSTVNRGTAACALAASSRRRTLIEKFGRVKRPSQELFGSRAIFQMRSAFCVSPLALLACHWCHEGCVLVDPQLEAQQGVGAGRIGALRVKRHRGARRRSRLTAERRGGEHPTDQGQGEKRSAQHGHANGGAGGPPVPTRPVLGVVRLEVPLARAADGAEPVVRNVLEGSPGSYAPVGIALGGVVDEPARGADVELRCGGLVHAARETIAVAG
jgi:hypothetical protein